jgi:three-Cys-motif partner protein
VALDPARYVIGDDGLVVEKVGPWAKDKLEIVGHYVQISGATRRKYRENRPAFIDVFCGPARSLVRSTGEYIDGSPVTAFKQGKRSVEGFATIEISDLFRRWRISQSLYVTDRADSWSFAKDVDG